MVALDTKAPVSRAELLGAALVSVVVAAGWYLLSLSLGAVGIARNDDWSFVENAFRFAETGDFAISGWVQMMLIGQLVLAAPVIAVFGQSVAALQGLVALLGALLLVSAYLLIRNFLTPMWAALATAITAASSLFGLLSISFMTDIPAAAFQLLALTLAYRAFKGDRISWPLMLWATVAALVAVSIREYAVVALAAIWLTALRISRKKRSYRAFLAWTASIAVVAIGMLLWRAGQVTVPDSRFGLNLFGIRYLPWWPLAAGWLLLPAIAAANPLAVARRAWTSSRVLTALAVLVAVAALVHTRVGFLGNYLSLSGGYAEVLRGVATPVLPSAWSIVVTIAAAYGAIVLALVLVTPIHNAWVDRRTIVDRPVSEVSLTVSFLVLTLAMYAIVPLLADVAMFDRYFIAVLPVAAGLILWWLMRQDLVWARPQAPVAAALVVVILTNSLITAATSARDAARWELASRAADLLGVAEGNIDGGFDYYSFNSSGIPRPDGVRWTWWTAYFGDRAVCATLTYGDVGVSDVAAGPEPNQAALLETIVAVPLARDQLLMVMEGPDSC